MRVGLALALSSFGSMGAAPIQGALLTAGFEWSRPIAFSAVSFLYFFSSLLFNENLRAWFVVEPVFLPSPAPCILEERSPKKSEPLFRKSCWEVDYQTVKVNIDR